MQNEDMLDVLYSMFQERINYEHLEVQIQKARKALMAISDDPNKESVILDYAIAMEKVGFRSGFIIATQIMAECVESQGPMYLTP